MPRVHSGLTVCATECPGVSQTAPGKLSNRLSNASKHEAQSSCADRAASVLTIATSIRFSSAPQVLTVDRFIQLTLCRALPRSPRLSLPAFLDPNTETSDGREAVFVRSNQGITRFVPDDGQPWESCGDCREASGPRITKIAERREQIRDTHRRAAPVKDGSGHEAVPYIAGEDYYRGVIEQRRPEEFSDHFAAAPRGLPSR